MDAVRVVLDNLGPAQLAAVRNVLRRLGYIALERRPEHGGDLGQVTVRDDADVAVVGVTADDARGLELISEVVREASCPVIALVEEAVGPAALEAAERGVFACVVTGREDELEVALAIALRRFSDYDNLQGAFGRRATIEQAKGILMARHSVEPAKAFQMLRAHSQRTDRRLIDIAEAIVESHALLLAEPEARPGDPPS